MQNAKKTFFPHSPTTCPSKHTKIIAKKLLVFFSHLFQNHLFSQGGVFTCSSKMVKGRKRGATVLLVSVENTENHQTSPPLLIKTSISLI
jgi:hypothetical protein